MWRIRLLINLDSQLLTEKGLCKMKLSKKTLNLLKVRFKKLSVKSLEIKNTVNLF